MTPSQTGGLDFDARIGRAKHLAAVHSFATEILTFYGHLVAFQKNLCAHLSKKGKAAHAVPAASDFRSQLDLAVLLPHFPDLLSLLQRVGPLPVAEAARHASLQSPATWSKLLSGYWSTAGRAEHPHETDQPAAELLTEFILRVFLQPYAELLAARQPAPPLVSPPSVCPLCGSRPFLGVLHPEGDGGKRHLVCSFCLYEWDFRRILCPACGEGTESKLPVYIAEQFPHLRVEACDTCKFYIRTIDLTKDGNAIPIVDDLAAIPLSLWAHEHHYTRLHANLLST